MPGRSLLAVLFGCLGVAAAAAAECPALDAYADGFIQRSADGQTEMTVRWLTPNDQLLETRVDSRIRTRVLYRNGLFPLASATANGLVTFEYRTDLTRFTLDVGSRIVYSAVVREANGEAMLQTSEMRVVAAETIQVGDCSFPVVRIERSNRYTSDKVPGNLVLAWFSPDLRVPLRTRTRTANGQERDFELKAIELLK